MGMARTEEMSENSMASSKPDALWAEPVWGVGYLLFYTDLMKVEQFIFNWWSEAFEGNNWSQACVKPSK